MDNGDDCETCWICLEGAEGPEPKPGPLHANRLIQPCRCPRLVHSVCLAKWQLSQSGKSEEKFCRFCKDRLPDWQENLALPGMAAVEPVMSVHFNGQTHMVKVKPGEEGRVAFIQDVRRLLRLRDNQEFSITFECKVPGHGMFLDLKGLSSYDAAVFCAAMTAVERQRLAAQKAQRTYGSGPASATSTSTNNPCATSSPAAPASAAGLSSTGSPLTPSSSASSTDAAGSAAPASTASGPHATSRNPARTVSLRRSHPGSDGATSDADTHHTSPSVLLLSESDAGSHTSSASNVNGDGGARGRGGSRGSLDATLSGNTGSSLSRFRFSRSRPRGGQVDSAGPTTLQSVQPSASGTSYNSVGTRLTGGSDAAAAAVPTAPTGALQSAAVAPLDEAGRAQPAGAAMRREARSHGACEVQPAAVAAGADTVGGAAVPGAARASPSAESAAERRKLLHRHGWHGITLRSGHAPSATATAMAGGEEVGHGAPWFSRLLMCGGFATGVQDPSH